MVSGLLAAVVMARPSGAQVRLSAVCDDAGMVTVELDLPEGAVPGAGLPETWAGLEVVRTAAGACGKPEILTGVLPLPGADGPFAHQFRHPIPEIHRTFRYAVRAVDAAALPLPDLDDDPDAVAHVAVGDAVLITGQVVHEGGDRFRLEGCDAGCWEDCARTTPAELGVTMVEMLTWATHHTTLSFYGRWADGADADGCFALVSDIKIVDPCAPTPNEQLTWSRLKQSYR